MRVAQEWRQQTGPVGHVVTTWAAQAQRAWPNAGARRERPSN